MALKYSRFRPPFRALERSGGVYRGGGDVRKCPECPFYAIAGLELALRGGFSAVSASEWNFCASFLSPSGPSLLSPFPRSASSRWQLVGWRVACQYCSVDLEVGAVNLAVSPLQHGLACGERISCGVGGSVMACGF